jgi:ABC-2 type transport system ATP-binding protein
MTSIYTPAIEITSVSKRLGNREILKNISFRVERGDIFGYLGPNGAGKTTTIRVILGLFKPNSGKTFILGENALTDDSRKSIGFVLEADGLYDNLSATENLSFYYDLYGVTGFDKAKRIKEMLTLVELADRAKDRVSGYSKGMRQKLALARAMINGPDLLILDEPTAGVDPTGQIEVRNLILNMAGQKGKTIFLSSHNLDEVQRVCNRIALIDKGEIKLSGDLEQLRQGTGKREVIVETRAEPGKEAKIQDAIAEIERLPSVRKASIKNHSIYLELDEKADIIEIGALLSARNIVVEQIKKNETTLEDLYEQAVKEEK